MSLQLYLSMKALMNSYISLGLIIKCDCGYYARVPCQGILNSSRD